MTTLDKIEAWADAIRRELCTELEVVEELLREVEHRVDDSENSDGSWGHFGEPREKNAQEALQRIMVELNAAVSVVGETVSHAVRDADSGLAQVLGHHDPTDALGYRAYERAYLRTWELTRLLSIARGYDLAA